MHCGSILWLICILFIYLTDTIILTSWALTHDGMHDEMHPALVAW